MEGVSERLGVRSESRFGSFLCEVEGILVTFVTCNIATSTKSYWKKYPNAPHKWSGALIDHTDFFAHPNATLIVFFLDLEFHSFSMVSHSHTIPIIKETASRKSNLATIFYTKSCCAFIIHTNSNGLCWAKSGVFFSVGQTPSLFLAGILN